MDFKTFFVKKIMMSFFISVTCISLAMGIIGLIFNPNTRFGYEAYFSPLIFGAIGVLPFTCEIFKERTVYETNGNKKCNPFCFT